MKNIILESIEFSGAAANASSIFAKTEKSIYFDVSKTSGKTIRIWYDYEENGEKKSVSRNITIPAGLNEQGVKDYILAEISK